MPSPMARWLVASTFGWLGVASAGRSLTITTSGFTVLSMFDSTFWPHVWQLLYALEEPTLLTNVAVHGQLTCVATTSFQCCAFAMLSSTSDHCAACESPTSATVLMGFGVSPSVQATTAVSSVPPSHLLFEPYA